MLRKSRLRWGITLLLGILLPLCLFASGCGAGPKVEPLSQTQEGIHPNTAFTIRAGKTNAEELQQRIELSPVVPFNLAQNQDGSFTLTPQKAFAPGQTVTLLIKDSPDSEKGNAFTFTVNNTLMVLSHFPADQGKKVKLYNGVEIELNSAEIPLSAFQEAFTISPPVEGDFSQNGYRYIFYPSNKGSFSYGATYTVTLDAQKLSEATSLKMEEGVSFSFTCLTESDDRTEYSFSPDCSGVYNTTPDQAPMPVFFIADELIAENPFVQVDLFQMDFQQFQERLEPISQQDYYEKNYDVSVEGLKNILSFEAFPMSVESSYTYSRSSQGLLFPKALEKGWYAARFTLQQNGEDITRYLLIQSTDLSIYTMTLNGENTETLAWINNTQTGQPVENAKITVSGDIFGNGSTNADGVAKVPMKISYTDEENGLSSRNLLTISTEETQYADILPLSAFSSENDSAEYIGYLYTDREIYRTQDTIHVWGIARPRYDDSPEVGELTLSFDDGAITQTVTPGPDGTFTAEISYENLTSRYWTSLRLLKGDTSLASHSISIQDYVKPIYTASSASSQPVYMVSAGSQIDIGLDVSTFDGTPASGFQMQMRDAWGNSGVAADPRPLETDQNGHIDSYITVTESLDTWRPVYYFYQFGNTQAENEFFFVSGDVPGIHRDVMLTGDLKMEKDTASVIVHTNQITLNNIKKPDDVWFYKNLKGAALPRTVQADLHKRYYEKVESGYYYDYILRENLPKYEYQKHDDIIDTYTFTTAGGSYQLNGLPISNLEEDACYYLELRTTDTKGGTVVENVYLGEWIAYRSAHQDTAYAFEKVSGNEQMNYSTIDQTIDQTYGDSYYMPDKNIFREGEDVTFALTLGGKRVSQLDGRLLYVTSQDSFQTMNIIDAPSFVLEYDSHQMPNYMLSGVYFDGKQAYHVEDLRMRFDAESRQLDIQLTPDKDSYEPSGKVTVTALVTDPATGKPADGASILLSAVDEAVFAIQEQYVDLPYSLHQPIYYPYLQIYESASKEGFDSGGGKGGGGGDAETRYKFLDTAQFATATTDASGKAVFTFQLPDNITEWRLTSLSLWDDYAGNTQTGIKATQPFFIQPVLGSTILVGDTLSVGIRSTGTEIQPSDMVSYRVTVEGDNGYKKTLVKTNPAGDYTCVDTYGLKAGEYTATISGSTNGLSDSIRLPFSVVESGIEVALTEHFSLQEPISVNSLRYPVSLSIYNHDAQLYQQVISNLLSNNFDYGARMDFRIANRYIASLYQEQGNHWYDQEALEDNFRDVSEPFLCLFPYDSLNYELTAKAYLAAPDLFKPAPDTDFLRLAMDYEGTGRTSSLYLLQALADPDIRSQVKKELKKADAEGFDLSDKMYLTTALAICGDTKEAQKYYEKWVTPNLKEMTGVSGEKALYVDIKDASGTFMTNTAAASMAASVLGDKDAEALIRYMISTKSNKEAYPLELVVFLEHYAPDTSSKAEFSYEKDGVAVTETLKGAQAVYLTMTKEQLAKANFKVLSGNVDASVFYWGAPSSRQESANQLIGLTKTLEPVEGSFAVGNLVKVTLTPDFSKVNTSVGASTLIINDYIPSGMRYEYTMEESFGYGWYLDNRQEQRITFNIYNADIDGGVAPIVYYVRCTTPGDYVNESAYINSAPGDVWGCSSRNIITITK